MLTCTPNATCPFIISPNGDIVTNADLHSYPNNSFQLSVVATDKYNKNPTSYTVIVEITAGEIRAKSVINFEKVNKLSYEVKTHAYDCYGNSTTETLTLLISDVNEKPKFTTTTWTITKNDESGPGEQISCPDFKNDIEDADVGDVHTYKMSCPRGRGVFVMDPLTGCVTMTKEWDLDAANKRLGMETVVCTVTATNRRGLETTATFNIKIKEEDDNKPFLSQTSYMYCATVGSTSGTLGQVTSTDNDVLDSHKTKKYEFVGSGPFYASGTGSLTYGDWSSYAKGTKFETTLRVTDSAGHYDESPVTIFICDPPPPAPSNPNSASGASSASSTSGGIDNILYWLIPALLLLALMAELAVYLIRRCIQGGRCAP
ncbi:uncharacterized protein LOC127863675 [Dreissena polymorpha]|uniref:uncharacterized protein LOC127863675 n=1 Tax=Dreissena polymorpha TaxID=45954 RepID=UPI0022649A25|nr:uncharacterized protein LOC127863675 [Dreissena polymorpha]